MRKPERPYHTAIFPEQPGEAMASRVEVGDSVVVQHDIFLPLPKEFARCDVLYAEPAWRPSFDEFNRRAGVTGDRTYKEYMSAIAKRIRETTVPVFLVVGPAMRKLVDSPTSQFPIFVEGPKATAYCFVYHRAYADPAARVQAGHAWGITQTQLLQALSREYRCVGDFCAGYGYTARVWAGEGLPFVMSDYNAKCVAYIGAHAPNWYAKH